MAKKTRQRWRLLDTQELLDRKLEDTTTANVGAYPVPIGGILRRAIPGEDPNYIIDPADFRVVGVKPKKKRKRKRKNWRP